MNQAKISNSLGGVINQDISKALLKPELVYNSENFRITTTDGSTFNTRTNLQGNSKIVDIPATGNVVRIDIPSNMLVGYDYTFTFTVNSVVLSPITLNCLNFDSFIEELAKALRLQLPGITISFFKDGIDSYITMFYTNGIGTLRVFCTTSSILAQLPIVNSKFTFDLYNWTPTGSPIWDGAYGGSALMYFASNSTQSLVQDVGTINDGLYSISFNSVCTSSITPIWLQLIIGGTTVYNGVLPTTITHLNFTAPIVATDSLIQIKAHRTVSNSASFYIQDITVTSTRAVDLLINNKYIKGSENLQIIGWTAIRDELYLFTTNCTTANPGQGDPESYGQIWKLTYIKDGNYANTPNYTLELIYNNILNFSTQHPIANPGAVETKYEASTLKKIYWTDNFNVPRFINVGNPNVSTLDPEILKVFPSVSFDIPNFTYIKDGGDLKSGMYEYVYRLKRKNGSESQFSMPSQLVIVTPYSEGSSHSEYRATDANIASGKTVSLNIENIDTTFDIIEVAFIYYGAEGSLPEAYIFYEGLVNNSTSINVKHSGEEKVIPITLDEVAAFNVNIVRAKTLATKNNTLFLANVKTKKFDVDFDARTYRFPLNRYTTIITDSQGVQYEVTFNQINNTFQIVSITNAYGVNIVTPYDIPIEHDCIQDYDSQTPMSTGSFLYNPNINDVELGLGGIGPNVSYEFVKGNILGDTKNIGQIFDPSSTNRVPYRSVDSRFTGNVDLGDRKHEYVNSFTSYVSPYFAPMMAGYQRDEMYRAGIVFIDSNGNESYVKWIGDIRIPHTYMPVNEGSHNRTIMFPTSTNKNLDGIYTHPIYIKFTVNTSTLPNNIKAYSIVFAPREDNDKRILGQGVFTPASKGIGMAESGYCAFLHGQDAVRNPGGGDTPYFATNGNFNNDVGKDDYWHMLASIKSPDFMFRDFTGWRAGDHIDFIGLLQENQYDFAYGSHAEVALTGEDGDTHNRSFGLIKHSDDVIPACVWDTDSTGPSYPVIEAAQVSLYDDTNPWFFLSALNSFSQYTTSNSFYITNSSPIGNDFSGNTAKSVYKTGTKTLVINFGNAPDKSSSDIGGSNDWLPILYGGLGYPEIDYWTRQSIQDVDSCDLKHAYNKAYVVNYKRVLTNQYGGNTYTQRSNTKYQYRHNLVVLKNNNITTVTVASGDTYTLIHDFVYHMIDEGAVRNRSHKMLQSTPSNTHGGKAVPGAGLIYMTPLESTINTELRGRVQDQVPNECEIPGLVDYGDPTDKLTLDYDESYEKFNVDLYSWNPSIKYFYPKPFDILDQEEFDVRTYKSESKNIGEVTDSWTIFKPEAYLDVDSKYGPINNLIVFKDGLYYFQDRAIGKFRVLEQAILPETTTTANMVLGNSGILDRYDYLSLNSGSKHQFGFSQNDSSLLWVDVLNKKLTKLSMGEQGGLLPISDLKGLSTFFSKVLNTQLQTNDNPYRNMGITSTYDFKNNEYLITLLNSTTGEYYTVAYSEILDGFTSFYSYHPKVFINDKINIFTVGNLTRGNSLYVNDYGSYGSFYDARKPADSSVTFIVNQEPGIEKVLTNFEFIVESYTTTNLNNVYAPFVIPTNKFFSQLRVFNTYQNTDFIETTEIAKRRKTIWNVKAPGNRVTYNLGTDIFNPGNISSTHLPQTERLKDRWFVVDCIYNNDGDKFVADMATSLVIPNKR